MAAGVLVCLIALLLCTGGSLAELKWPIILVPGDGGSQLEARLNRSSAAHFICSKQTADYYNLWLNLEQLLVPFIFDCWLENMMLKYDNVTRTTYDSDGVQIRVPGWGNTTSVDYLDPNEWSLSQYYHTITENLATWGYVRGKSIRGAPYDFRKAPNEFGEYYEKMKALIEETYYQNGNKKVVIIGHSMGNPVMLRFYHMMDQSWKDKFLRAHVSIAGAWGGAVKTVKMLASGYNLDHYKWVLNPLKIRPLQRSMTSSAYLLPSPMIWQANETLVFTENKNYSMSDIKDFYDDIGFSEGYRMYEDTKDLFGGFKAPGVEVHCLCGTKMKTPELLIYGKKSFPDYQPTEIYGDGDGTVNTRSCKACQLFKNQQRQEVYYEEFPNQEHLDMLSSEGVVEYLKNFLTSSEKMWKLKRFLRLSIKGSL